MSTTTMRVRLGVLIVACALAGLLGSDAGFAESADDLAALQRELAAVKETPSAIQTQLREIREQLQGDGKADIVTAAGPGGGPHVRVLSGRTARSC